MHAAHARLICLVCHLRAGPGAHASGRADDEDELLASQTPALKNSTALLVIWMIFCGGSVAFFIYYILTVWPWTRRLVVRYTQRVWGFCARRMNWLTHVQFCTPTEEQLRERERDKRVLEDRRKTVSTHAQNACTE